MSSSNTPESGAVSRIGHSSRVLSTPLPVVVTSTVDPTVITPFCTTLPPAVASVSESEPLAT